MSLDLFGAQVEDERVKQAVPCAPVPTAMPAKRKVKARTWQATPVGCACYACHTWDYWSSGNCWVCSCCHPAADPGIIVATCRLVGGVEVVG